MQEAAPVAWLFEQSLLPFQIKTNKHTQKSQKQQKYILCKNQIGCFKSKLSTHTVTLFYVHFEWI